MGKRILLLVGLALASCSQWGEANSPQVEPRPSASAPSDGERVTTIPTPGQATGVVIGRIVSVTTEAPLVAHAVYLGEILPLEPGPEYLVTLQVETSPHTVTDSDGTFALGDVEPGSYPLIIWTPFQSFVVPDDRGEKEMQVVVKAGEVTDLGELRVQWP